MSILDKLNSEQKKAGAKVNGPLGLIDRINILWYNF